MDLQPKHQVKEQHLQRIPPEPIAPIVSAQRQLLALDMNPKQFVQGLLNIKHPWTQQLLQTNLVFLLNSRHQHLDCLFNQLKDRQQYHQGITQFMHHFLNQSPALSERLEMYLINEIWRPSLLPFVQQVPMYADKIILMLCMKMRSLQPSIRKQALQSYLDMVTNVTASPSPSLELYKSLSGHVPRMVEKQVLLKTVTFSKGMYLQLLEDQLHEIRVNCMKCIAVTSVFLSMPEIKPLVLYMLNDEHHLVREESLKVAASLHFTTLSEEDVMSLLVCLREKTMSFRVLVYDCLRSITIGSWEHLSLIFDKLLEILLDYRSDKKTIYSLLHGFSYQYQSLVEAKVCHIYPFNQQEEPNCKNITYKARVILLFSIPYLRRKHLGLPYYFETHRDYVSNVESYLVDPSIKSESETTHNPIQPISINCGSKELLLCYLRAEQHTANDFIREILVLTEKRLQNVIDSSQLWLHFHKLQLLYCVTSETRQLLSQLHSLLKQDGENEGQSEVIFRVINQLCLKGNGTEIPRRTFKMLKHSANVVVVDGCREFVENCYLRLSSKKGNKYVRIALLEPFQRVGNNDYYHLSTHGEKIECLLVYNREESDAVVISHFERQ